jgi:flagellar biosynthesis protein FlhB
MELREWPYWLKGGLITLGLFIVISLFLKFFGDLYAGIIPSLGMIEFLDMHFLPSLEKTFFPAQTLEELSSTIIKGIVFASIFYFVIGSLLGKLYELVKKSGFREFVIYFLFGLWGVIITIILSIFFYFGEYGNIVWLIGFIIGFLIGKLIHKKNLLSPRIHHWALVKREI